MVSLRQMFSSKKSQALLVLLPDGSMKMYTKKMTVKDLLLEFPAFTVALDPAPAPALDDETVLAAGGTYYLNPLDGEPPDADAAGNERPALPPRSASCDQGGGSAGQQAAREVGGVPSRTVSAAAALARVDVAPEEAAAPASETASPSARAKPKETDSYADVDDELLAYLDMGDTPAAPPAPPATRHITKFGQEDASLFSDTGSSRGGSARGSPAVGGNSPSGFGGPVLSGMNALGGSVGGGSPMGGVMARRSMGMEYGSNMMGGASAAAAAVAAAAASGNMGMGGGQYRRPGPKMMGVMGGVALESPATHLDRNDSYSSAGSGGGSGTFTVW
ncbi:unnamed protein product [Closterium sp. Naga37s-1]|nr:unnamed protein product [Closterium sp. Naga37s-1]